MKIRKLNEILETIDSFKATDITVYNLEESSPFYQYLIIATANIRQSNAIVAALKKLDYNIKGVEDSKTGWVLIDIEDIVVHVFSQELREFYQLDKLFYKFKNENYQNSI